jgi:hypothetical protein
MVLGKLPPQLVGAILWARGADDHPKAEREDAHAMIAMCILTPYAFRPTLHFLDGRSRSTICSHVMSCDGLHEDGDDDAVVYTWDGLKRNSSTALPTAHQLW